MVALVHDFRIIDLHRLFRPDALEYFSSFVSPPASTKLPGGVTLHRNLSGKGTSEDESSLQIAIDDP